jgi:hypothetical protein
MGPRMDDVDMSGAIMREMERIQHSLRGYCRLPPEVLHGNEQIQKRRWRCSGSEGRLRRRTRRPTRSCQTRDMLPESTPSCRVGLPCSGVGAARTRLPDPASPAPLAPAFAQPSQSRSRHPVHPAFYLHTSTPSAEPPAMRRRLAPVLSRPPVIGMADGDCGCPRGSTERNAREVGWVRFSFWVGEWAVANARRVGGGPCVRH